MPSRIFSLTPVIAIWLMSLGVSPLPAESSAPVEIQVFSDFQCPYCAGFAKPVHELKDKGVEAVPIKVVFRHFPLSFHANAQLAHQAAVAAEAQGKLWEMHDLLFANQSALQREALLAYAKQLGLDVARFAEDLDSAAVKQAVDADKAEGAKLGVEGTPTFFVNGKAYTGAKTYEQLKELILGEERKREVLAELPDRLMSQGPANAPVILEFYADLQSPVSRPAMALVQEMLSKYPDRVRLQFRSFPLSFHAEAGMAHEAAMIGAVQGRFWQFVDFILSNQDSLREQDLVVQAGKLGLDAAKFREKLGERRYSVRVESDVAEGLKRGIRGSPVIFVNDQRIDGVPDRSVLEKKIETALMMAKK